MSTFERTARATRATERFDQILHARTVQRVSELDGVDAAARLDKFRQRREHEQLMAKEENDLVKLAEAIEEVLHVGSTHVHSILVDNTCSRRVFNEFASRPQWIATSFSTSSVPDAAEPLKTFNRVIRGRAFDAYASHISCNKNSAVSTRTTTSVFNKLLCCAIVLQYTRHCQNAR